MSKIQDIPNLLPCAETCMGVTHSDDCEYASLERSLWGIAIDEMLRARANPQVSDG